MEYNIIWSANFSTLIQQVNSEIKDGWKPIGGVCVETLTTIVNYYQAMIKEVKL